MTSGLSIREASERDAGVCAAIYAPYVIDTAISFELEPPTADEMAGRIASATARHAWLLLEDAGRVVGFGYGIPFAERAAYRWACQTSVYMEMGRRRTGGGRILYTTLLDRLAERGYRRALAGITLPNEASAGLHRALGFEPVGVYRRVGWKNNAWHDVAWVQKTITADEVPLIEPH